MNGNSSNNNKQFHLVGIGGVGISWIAEILLAQGHSVSGSDLQHSSITEHLKSLGAKIFIGHDEKWVENADILIHTAAVDENHIELQKANSLGIPIYNRAEMQGKLIDTYPTSLAISGSHGKSTTTSMIATILTMSDVDPTLLIGAHLDALGGNAKIGNGDILVMEACEYKDSFLNFKPTYGMILNIDEDHLDYFKDFEHILSSFVKFANGVSPDGAVFINTDDISYEELIKRIQRPTISIGLSKYADYHAQNININSNGHPEYDVIFNDDILCHCQLSVAGEHNVYNSLFAIAFCHHLGIDLDIITQALKQFKNPSRRFESIGTFKDSKVIDDYAHHPKEINATLTAARHIHKKRIVCVFQPHTYTRTYTLLDEFSKSFSDADEIIIVDIYAAREIDEKIVSSEQLAKKITEQGKSCNYIPSYDELKSHLSNTLTKDDLLIMMGAGSISQWAHDLVASE